MAQTQQQCPAQVTHHLASTSCVLVQHLSSVHIRPHHPHTPLVPSSEKLGKQPRVSSSRPSARSALTLVLQIHQALQRPHHLHPIPHVSPSSHSTLTRTPIPPSPSPPPARGPLTCSNLSLRSCRSKCCRIFGFSRANRAISSRYPQVSPGHRTDRAPHPTSVCLPLSYPRLDHTRFSNRSLVETAPTVSHARPRPAQPRNRSPGRKTVPAAQC